MSTESALQDAAWFEREAAALRRLARALVAGDAELDDLLQESWLAARRLPEPPREPRAWMRRVLERLALRGGVRAAARHSRERAVARPESVEGPDASIERAELLRRVLAELATLTPSERRALHAVFLEDRTPRDAARALGMNENTLRSHVRRGLATLRERLDRQRPREEWMRAFVLGLGIERHGTPPAGGIPASAPAEAGVGTAAGVAIGGGVMAVGWKPVAAGVAVIAVIAWFALRPADGAPPPAPASTRDSEAVASLEQGAPTEWVGRRAELSPREIAAEEVDRPATAGTAEAAVSTRIVRGVVVDWLGSPVAGAEILDGNAAHLYAATPVFATTDRAGRFEARVERSAKVYARAGGYAPSMTAPVVAAEAVQEVELVLPWRGGCVEGVVTSCDGVPASAVVVRVGVPRGEATRDAAGEFTLFPPGRSVTTDSAGRFRVEGVAFGRASVWARDESCGLGMTEVEVGPGTVNLPLQLREEARLRGVVRDSNGAPIERASVGSVGAPDLTAVTDRNGRFELRGLPQSCMRMWVARSGRSQAASESLVLRAGEISEWNPVLQALPSSLVRGHLLGSPDGGFDGWSIRFGGEDAMQLGAPNVRADGGFEFDAQGRVSIAIAVFAPGFARPKLPVLVAPDVDLSTGSVELRVPDVLPEPAGVRVRIVDAMGAPVACSYLNVEFASQRGEVLYCMPVVSLRQEPGSGLAVASDLPPADYLLRCVAKSIAMEPLTLARFSLAPGERRDLGELVVPQPGGVRVHLETDGAAVDGQVESGSILARNAATPSAMLLFRERVPERVSLLPGHYQFNLCSRGEIPHARLEFDVEPGKETSLVVDLRRRREQRVRILPRAGSPATGVLQVRSRASWLGQESVERPWSQLEFPRVGDSWERTVQVDLGIYEFLVEAGAAGHARIEHDCFGTLPERLTIQLE